MHATNCFDLSTYELMLAGQLPAAEVDNVCAHLERCDRCCQKVRNLPEDSIVALMRAQDKKPANAVKPAFVQGLVQKILKQSSRDLPNPTVFACPGCRTRLQIKKELSGQNVKCPKCGQVMRITAISVANVPASASATKEDAGATETLPPNNARPLDAKDAPTLPPSRSRAPEDTAAESGLSENLPEGRLIDYEAPLPIIPGYEIEDTLGRGGMGVVYQARHLKLNRIVALKMILAGSHAGGAELARFQTEAQAIARLQHPNIVQVHEVGEHEGKPFFSLEFCGGGSLAQKLGGTPLPAREAAALVETLARAMQAAHDQNVIHRDLKPANVLLTEAGVPKITDFGLAKKIDEAGQTQSGAIMGTPSYMAPEQAAGESSAIGPLADVYTLGAILYECLTGRPPFRAATSLETMMQVTQDEPVPPSQLQSKTPKDLETICLKCLHKESRKRYGTAQELADDLRRFLSGEPVLARPVGKLDRAWRWCRRKPALAAATAAAALGVFLALVAFGAAFFVVSESRDDAIDSANKLADERNKVQGANIVLQDTNEKLNVARSDALAKEKEAREHEAIAKKAREDAEQQRDYAEKRALQIPFETFYLGAKDDFRLAMLRTASLVPQAARLKDRSLFDSMCLHLGVWSQEVHRLRAVCPQALQPGSARAIAFSPDGKTVLTGSNKRAQLWETATGRPLGLPLEHQKNVTAVAFSPDGKTVLTGSYDKMAQLWETATGRPLGLPLQHQDEVYAVAFSPDGKTVLTGGRKQLPNVGEARLWDSTGRPLGPPLQNKYSVHVVAFSPDGKTMLTGEQLWETATRKPLGSPLQHQGTVRTVAFSPDGKTVLTSGGKTARVWDTSTGEPFGPPLQHEENLNAVALSPDGKTVLTGSGSHNFGKKGEARLWETATGKQLGPTIHHQFCVHAVAFSPDGKTVLTGSGEGLGASASHNGESRLWDVATGKPFGAPLQTEGGVYAVAFSPDGNTVLTASKYGGVRLWETAQGKQFGPILQHQQRVSAVAFSPDGKIALTGSIDKTARLWDTVTGEPLGPSLEHQGGILAVAFSPDGKIALTGSVDKTARLWETATGKQIGPSLQHQDAVNAVAFSPDGKAVLTGSLDKTARLWETATGKQVGPSLEHTREVRAVAFSPDGKTLLTGSEGTTARLWETATGKPLGPPPRNQSTSGAAVAFSPNGKIVLVGSLYDIRELWEITTGKSLGPPLGHKFVQSVAFSPDGKKALTGSSDKTAVLWETATAKPLGQTLRHQGAVVAVAFSPDGMIALTGSVDKTAQLWETATGKPLGSPLQHQGTVRTVAFSPDGKTVLTGSDDKTARLWRVPKKIQGDPERIVLWVQVITTGLQFDEFGVRRGLDAATWQKRRERLQELGGPPESADIVAWKTAPAIEPIPIKRINPKDAKTWYNLGSALQVKKDLPGAIDAYKKALAIDPNYASAWNNLGNALQQQKDLPAAIDAYKKALILEPKNDTAWNNLGNAFYHQKDLPAAIDAYNKSLAINTKRPNAWYNLGLALQQQKDLPGAVIAFERTIELKPEFAEAHCTLSHALRDKGDFVAALNAAEEGHRLGSLIKGWTYSSADSATQCKELVALDKRLPGVLQGEQTSVADLLALAKMCGGYKKRYRDAFDLYVKAFAADPKLAEDLAKGHRYNAACYTALAASVDADKLNAKQQARLRQQAFDWLKADLALHTKMLEKDPAKTYNVMQHWQRDVDLASLRDEKELAKLPADERAALTTFWGKVDRLAKEARKIFDVGIKPLTEPEAAPPKDEVFQDRNSFIPQRKHVAIKGAAIGILLQDGQPVLRAEGRSGPPNQLVFGMDGCSYRWVYVAVPPPAQIQKLQVPLANGDKKTYLLLDTAKPQNVGVWNVTKPYSLVQVEVNDGLGSPATDSFVATNMKVLDGTKDYPLNVTEVVAELRKKYAMYQSDQANAIEAAMNEAQKKALKDRKPTGPRQQVELMYLTWMPETNRLRVHFRTKISDGDYTFVEKGGGKLPAAKIKVGITFGIEFGRAFEVDKNGNLVSTQSLPIEAFQSETKPPPKLPPG